ncbi:MAG TPA: M15 family metallopeptidase [Candidatus Paceibacterota bacterium]
MKEPFTKQITKEIILSFIGLAIIAVSFSYITSIYIASEEANIRGEANLKKMTLVWNKALSDKAQENTHLEKVIEGERQGSKQLEGQIGNLNSTLDILEKYAKTDKQLLEKYSKVYFLSENYIPEALVPMDNAYLFEKTRTLEFHGKAYPFLTILLGKAKSEGMDLFIASAYRSFGTQSSLKTSYKTTFGTTAANKFSADQGYSEHQLGTTVDFTTPTVGGALNGFENTKEYLWLVNNAYKFGFTLSYPANNKYYIFEPWHWRFVGVSLASHLRTEGKHFYDIDQRDINEYLVQMFDQN